jgi:hypothetical protein
MISDFHSVKEPQNPVQGEMSLDQFGNLVIFLSGRWVLYGR